MVLVDVRVTAAAAHLADLGVREGSDQQGEVFPLPGGEKLDEESQGAPGL